MCSIRWAGSAIFAPGACASSAMRRRASARTCCASFAGELAGNARVERGGLHRLGADLYRDLVLLRAGQQGDAVQARRLLALAAGWRPREFPLKGRDVTALGVAEGPEVGRLLAAVEAWWEEGDFRADRKAALAELKRRMAKR